MIQVEIARLFEEIADLLDIRGEDPFRVNAYRKAARALQEFGGDIVAMADSGTLTDIPGIGKSSAEKIMEYLRTGRIALHRQLLDSMPPGLPELLRVPGLGPKKVRRLYEELGIGSLAELEQAINEGKLDSLKGFGDKSVAALREGLAFLARSAGRTPLALARAVAEPICKAVAAAPGVRRVETAGSLRRGRETVGDIDILAMAGDGSKAVEAFTALARPGAIRAAGSTRASILVPGPEGGQMQIDLRVVPPESFGAALQYFTGSREHNVRLRELAAARNWRLNEYGLFDGRRAIAGEHEEDIYRRLGLAFIPPELREDRGEIEYCGDFSELVRLEDIRGDLHVHTTASDGFSSPREMAEAAARQGWSYLAICDHSRSSVIANGLSIERLRAHAEAVRALNGRLRGLTLLAGTECDILPDGSLDYPDEVLADLDWVVASVHSAMNQDRATLTRRCVAAMENPFVNVLAHPSGRLLGRRDAMDIDWEALFAAAARTGTALEISASWQRLDLKDTHVRQAMQAGCLFCIDTDAHDADQLDQMPLGVLTARRGWALRERVVNTWPLKRLREWVRRKRRSSDCGPAGAE